MTILPLRISSMTSGIGSKGADVWGRLVLERGLEIETFTPPREVMRCTFVGFDMDFFFMPEQEHPVLRQRRS
jgi:hypothetical protein